MTLVECNVGWFRELVSYYTCGSLYRTCTLNVRSRVAVLWIRLRSILATTCKPQQHKSIAHLDSQWVTLKSERLQAERLRIKLWQMYSTFLWTAMLPKERKTVQNYWLLYLHQLQCRIWGALVLSPLCSSTFW